jgi:hypothetical protein
VREHGPVGVVLKAVKGWVGCLHGNQEGIAPGVRAKGRIQTSFEITMLANLLFLAIGVASVTPAFETLAATSSVASAIPNASSIIGLTVAGYQGWFATPGDDDNNGWIHWGQLKAGTGIQEDYWPEMKEFTAPEKHVAPGYMNKDGSQAELFSSDNAATVLRHFQWMEAYGIDGVAVQRFGVEMTAVRRNRILNYTVAAAKKTNRVMYVEYDLSGMKEADIVAELTKDWAKLVGEGITSNPR